jgi:hypothetical protein
MSESMTVVPLDDGSTVGVWTVHLAQWLTDHPQERSAQAWNRIANGTERPGDEQIVAEWRAAAERRKS